jgi:aldehyde dehydrogenase family 7 protein A1
MMQLAALRSLRTLSRSSLRSFASSSNHDFIQRLGLQQSNLGVVASEQFANGSTNVQVSPSTGQSFTEVVFGTEADYDTCVAEMNASKAAWANTPAPIRGEVVRRIGELLREKKADLGAIVSLEMGKIRAEGEGEVQEAIDICDFAVGLSRQLNGKMIPSERPDHVMLERYNPLNGHVGIITAFNFPVAVFFWNAALSLVCGNTNLWKPAPSGSAVAVATMKIVREAFEGCYADGVISREEISPSIVSLICGGTEIGEKMIHDPSFELVSFTGSTKVGKRVSEVVNSRLGKTILELGGNNATIVDEKINPHKDDTEMIVRSALFGAVGTAGQRCTSLRRLIIHESRYQEVVDRLVASYTKFKIGDPLEEGTLCGPLHNQAAVDTFERTIEEAKSQGGNVLVGGTRCEGMDGFFVHPTIIEIDPSAPVTREERFVPILYVMKTASLEEGIALNNSVPQGLSSSVFTQNIQSALKWIGPLGSDCGIVNVNIGTSGAEIGGAFGGEKETGGGRESGSDAWKQYMRRSTITMNYSDELPLAQGIHFGD